MMAFRSYSSLFVCEADIHHHDRISGGVLSSARLSFSIGDVVSLLEMSSHGNPAVAVICASVFADIVTFAVDVAGMLADMFCCGKFTVSPDL